VDVPEFARYSWRHSVSAGRLRQINLSPCDTRGRGGGNAAPLPDVYPEWPRFDQERCRRSRLMASA